MIKTCGKTASRDIYSRKELEILAVERLGWNLGKARRMPKKELCEALNIEWFNKPEPNTDKVCSARRSRLFPNRYTKNELVDMIRARNPYMTRSKLLGEGYEVLCRLARVPFVVPPPLRPNAAVAQPARDKSRFFKEVVEVGGGEEERKESDACMERGNKKAFQYQRRVVNHFRRHRGLVAVHSLGSGKTLTAVYASQCYLDENPTHRVVVVCPTTLIENFKKEMREFGDARHVDRYEFFSFQGFYSRYKTRARNCRDTFLIVDEAHNLRTEYRKGKKKVVGKYCGVITRCAERANRVLLLTATPLVNKTHDIASLLNMVRDNPTTQNQILRKDFLKNAHDDGYLRNIGLCRFSFYERDRANADYPRVVEENVYLPMPARFREMYRKVEEELMEDDILRTFGESRLKPFFNGIRRAVNILSELPEEEMIKSPKIRWILEQLRGEEKKKTLVFSNFLEMGIHGIQARLPPGIRSAFITGSQPKARRAEIVRQYNNDEIDVLFLSRAGGEGIDLKGTRRIILLENGWNENSESQVIGRGVRYKSHSHLPKEQQEVHIYRLFHVKPDEVDDIDRLLSDDVEVVFNDPSTWLSADLMLKKISTKKFRETKRFLERLKDLSIEKNDC